MTAGTAARASVSLEARDIHKTLGGTKVLRGVDVRRPGGQHSGRHRAFWLG